MYFAYPHYKEYIDRDSFIKELPVDEEGFMLDRNVKFSRMVSLNEAYTVVGLKAVPPKKAKAASSSRNSQYVDDYVENMEDIKQYSNKNEEVLETYNQLTVGYQKDWARYVYSAKRKEAQEKRLLEMEAVLDEGFKTMELYKRSMQ